MQDSEFEHLTTKERKKRTMSRGAGCVRKHEGREGVKGGRGEKREEQQQREKICKSESSL